MKNPLILVVDDEIDFRDTLADYVTDRVKCKLLKTNNGDEALEILKREKIDVLLIDIQMPGISGFEVMEYVKEKNLNISMFCITKHDDTAYTSRIYGLGAKYVPKPIELKHVVKLIKADLGTRGGFDYEKEA